MARDRISRRAFLASSAALPVVSWGLARAAETKPVTSVPVPQALRGLDEFFAEFFRAHQPPGMAVAVSANSKLVYTRGFGFADKETSAPVTPTSLFRIASISKPFTAASVFWLVERDRIKLDDPVLKYVRSEPFLTAGQTADPRWDVLTVRHCLQHTGGWDRDKTFDPVSPNGNWRVANEMGIKPPAPVADFIRYMRGQPLDFDPGSAYVYSNFGYCLLGRVIEAVSGVRYEEFLKKEILKPLGITRMCQAGNLLENRVDGEVKYYDSQGRTGPAAAGARPGENAPLPYGRTLVESQDAAGGWLASAVDLVKFGCAFDNPKQPHVLKAASLREMFAPPAGTVGHDANNKPKERYYGCGWEIRPIAGSRVGGTKWHVGNLDGTSTILVCRYDAINWAVLFNSDGTADGKAFAATIDDVIHPAIDAVKAWPRVDLFPRFMKH